MSIDNAQFGTVVEYLRESRGVDFSGYKPAVLMRRITKRCAELGLEDFAAYIDYLQVHPDEFQSLFDRILINVTEFFRDKSEWDYIAATIVPEIVARDRHDPRLERRAPRRAKRPTPWRSSCARRSAPNSSVRRVKIYATDVDEDALGTARQTGYGAKQLESLDRSCGSGTSRRKATTMFSTRISGAP